MKVLFIQPLLPSYAISFFNTLSEVPGVEVVVLADIESKSQLNQYNSSYCKFDVIQLAQVDFFGVVWRPALIALLKNISFDTVVFNANPRDISQIFAISMRTLVGKKSYSWGMFHRIGGERFISRLIYKVISFCSEVCFCFSERGVREQALRGVSRGKLVSLGTAIDEKAVFQERSIIQKVEVDSLKENYNLVGKKIILQVVRLSSIKNPMLLIDAASILKSSGRQFVFVLIGGGDLELDVKRKIEKLGLGDCVLQLGPIYDESVLAKWFTIADAFVVPSCIGLSAHHAMCYGLPVITDDDYISQSSEFEILSNGLNSLLYKAGSAQSLAGIIEKVATDSELSAVLSSNAEYTVRNINTLNAKVDCFYKTLVGRDELL